MKIIQIIASINYFLNYNNPYILTGSFDNTAKVWDLISGKCISTYQRQNPVTSVDVSGCRNNLLYSREHIQVYDDELLLYSSIPNNPIQSLVDSVDLPDVKTTFANSIKTSAVAVSQCGTYYAVANTYDNSIRIYNLTNVHNKVSNNPIQIFVGHTSEIMSMKISVDSKFIVSGGRDGNVIIYEINPLNKVDLKDNVNQKSFKYKTLFDNNNENEYSSKLKYEHAGPVTSVGISPSNRYVLSASILGELFLYDVFNNNLKKMNNGFNGTIAEVKINDKYILTGGFDGIAYVYDYLKNVVVSNLNHSSPITSLALSDNGDFAVTTGIDNNIHVWDTYSGDKIKTIKGHEDKITSVALSFCANN